METIVIMGAAGKMGTRVSERLRGQDYRPLYVEADERGVQRLHDRGDQPSSTDDALPQADIVLLAVPDTILGAVAEQAIGYIKPGTLVVVLDPAAPYAGKLPAREDVSYFITHPCHPPVFKDEDDAEARRDFFGAGLARQSIVNALMQGPEEAYQRGERLARVLWRPILRSHRVTVEQMAYLEPLLSETIAQTCVAIIREAVDEAVKRGVPEEAARDFVLGHVGIQLAIFFDEIDWQISDGAKLVLRVAKNQLIQPDWKRLFEREEVKKSCQQIVGDLPVPSASN